jgi:hypothetical protein
MLLLQLIEREGILEFAFHHTKTGMMQTESLTADTKSYLGLGGGSKIYKSIGHTL